MLEQDVKIKILRDSEETFVPITTPDAVIYGIDEEGDAFTLTNKLADVDTKLDSLFGEDDSIGSRLNRIDADLDSIHNQIDGKNNPNSIQKQITNNDKDIEKLNRDVVRIDGDIATINTTLKTKANKTDVEREIRRIDKELDTKGTIYIADGQYGENIIPSKGTAEYCNTYNKHYIDNYMISKKQAETYIAQTIDSQTYSKAEMDKMIGQSLHVLVYEQGISDITIAPDYKCQYLDIANVIDDVKIKFPDMPENDVNYRYAKFYLYINSNDKTIDINNKQVKLDNGISEIVITYILGNWLITKTEFIR